MNPRFGVPVSLRPPFVRVKSRGYVKMTEMVPASIPTRGSQGDRPHYVWQLLPLSEILPSVDPARAVQKSVFCSGRNRELILNRENSYHGGSVSSIEQLGPSFCTIFLATLGTFKSLNSLKKLGAEYDPAVLQHSWLPCRLYHPPISFQLPLGFTRSS
jgi:hypothetical protein